MTDQTSTGGAGGDGGAVDGEGKGKEQETGDKGKENQPEMVSKAELDRALADMHKFKDQARDAQSTSNNLQNQIDDLKKAKLHESEDYKTLYEQEKQRREELEGNNTTLKGSVLNSHRHAAIVPALQKAGLRDDARGLYDIHDWSSVDVEATSGGRFLVRDDDVERAVELFKAKHPYAFDAAKAPHVNGGTGTGSPPPAKGITPDDLVKKQQECKRKGDMAPYLELRQKYDLQRRA